MDWLKSYFRLALSKMMMPIKKINTVLGAFLHLGNTLSRFMEVFRQISISID